MDTITIFTDGASRGNPGPGGWGSLIATKEFVVELGGRADTTTNNRMEMQAVISALSHVDKRIDGQIIIYTDSQYVINGATKWIHGWKKNGWKTKDNKEVQNRDLWEQMDAAMHGKKISWQAVGGHVGIPGNERVDEIATLCADQKPARLYDGSRKAYPIDVSIVEGNTDAKVKKQRSGAKAFSYLSLVNGEVKRHDTWASCEACVSGLSGVKYRKAVSLEDEKSILDEWGVSL